MLPSLLSARSMSCIATTSCVNQAPLDMLVPSGSVRPPPALRDTEKKVGAPNTRVPLRRAPLAGLVNGSRAESARAMDRPPMPRFAEGGRRTGLHPRSARSSPQ